MRERADVVGVPDQSDFVGVLDDAQVVDGGLEEGGVDLTKELGSGEVVGRGIVGVAGARACWRGIGGGEVVGRVDGVDVVFCLGFGDGEGEAGPDDGVGVDGRDVEVQFGGFEGVG